MLKNVKKSKILLSLIAILLMVALCGNVYSLATEGNTVTITATTDNTSASQNTNTKNTNTNTNSSTNITPIVSSSGNNTANNTTNNTANNATNNASTYNNTNATSNSSGLPYTGTNSSAIVFIIVFALSAVYAYKKVSDYNV